MPALLPAQTIIGQRLRLYRQEQGLTHAQLGEKLGWVGNSACSRLSRYERGVHEADLKTLERVARVLDKPLPCFFASCEPLAEVAEIMESLSEKDQEMLLLQVKIWIKDRSSEN